MKSGPFITRTPVELGVGASLFSRTVSLTETWMASLSKYHGMSTKVEDHQLIAVSQSSGIFGDEMLSLSLSLEGKCGLDMCLGACCSHCSIEYWTEIVLNGFLAPRPRLGDAQGQGA